jgi:hypothetical protein
MSSSPTPLEKTPMKALRTPGTLTLATLLVAALATIVIVGTAPGEGAVMAAAVSPVPVR